MAVVLDDEGMLLGWVLVDLDDPGPKRLYHAAEKMGVRVEDLIELACAEKADRIDAEASRSKAARPDASQTVTWTP